MSPFVLNLAVSGNYKKQAQAYRARQKCVSTAMDTHCACKPLKRWPQRVAFFTTSKFPSFTCGNLAFFVGKPRYNDIQLIGNCIAANKLSTSNARCKTLRPFKPANFCHTGTSAFTLKGFVHDYSQSSNQVHYGICRMQRKINRT